MPATLLVPLDGSPLADAAIPHAVEIARRVRGEIVLVRVHTPGAMVVAPPEAPIFIPDPAFEERMREAASGWLLAHAAALRATAGVPILVDFRIGVPVDQIVAAATEHRASAIVCATHGWGGQAVQWLGSVADALIRSASCPVLAMSEDGAFAAPQIRTLLVPLDGSPVSLAILPHAAWLAKAFGAEVELLQVVAPYWVDDSLMAVSPARQDPFGVDGFTAAVKDSLDATAAKLRREGLRVKTSADIDTSPGRAILRHVSHTKPDAIALSTYGRGLSRLFLGSVADKVLRGSGRPVLLFRPSEAAVETAATTFPAQSVRPVQPRVINRNAG